MDNLLKYGVDSNLASIANSVGLNVTTIRNTSRKNLKQIYGLNEVQIKKLKEAVTRKPIPENTAFELLKNSNYVCCACKSDKGDSYILHHIIPYNINQNNDYDNLAVLCPNDHELAHRNGEALAHKLSAKEIRKLKKDWEKTVVSNNIRRSVISGEINDIDYINVNRILELSNQVLGEIPTTKYTLGLLNKKLILDDGSINPELYERYNLNPNTPLKFFAMYGSTALIMHYYEILLKVFNRVIIYDLDNLLKIKELKKGIIGKYCFYTGGVYGRQYRGEINKNSEPTLIHFRRKPFFVEWNVDPMFITSTSASCRISKRPIYLIYGKILNVIEEIENDEKRLLIDIRPYAFGLTKNHKNRTPEIHFRDIDFSEYEDDEE